jgi:rhodanese-related sulfurtransferase/glyoxylase-like metal-dependent hydrolase (beta-lactamase superfamily II)
MILDQYYLSCLSHASYLIADEKSRVAAVVDPQRDIDQYLEDAKAKGLTIKYVILTHFHADFLAGHIELRERAGAEIVMARRAGAEFSVRYVGDGDRIELGPDVVLEFMETPGHTPEGLSVLVFDNAADAKTPHAVLTGDTLFVGDVGRPDLLASIGVTADELAEMLFDSIFHKISKLPDSTLVYPAHGAGSMCGKNLGQELHSTIGEQKRFNYAMKPMSMAQFKEIVTADQPEAPDYFVHDAILNRQERPALENTMTQAIKPIPLEKVLEMAKAGAQLLDVREGLDYAGSHLTGSINIALKGKYATWAGSMLNSKDPIIVIGDSDQVEEAVMRLGRIGFDNAAGYLEGGMKSLENHPELERKTRRITAQALADMIAADAKPTIIDVRSEKEYAGGHIDGSLNIPVNHLADRVSKLSKTGTVIVHCEGGYRSAIAAGILMNAGFENVIDLVGGYKAWVASQTPVNAG